MVEAGSSRQVPPCFCSTISVGCTHVFEDVSIELLNVELANEQQPVGELAKFPQNETENPSLPKMFMVSSGVIAALRIECVSASITRPCQGIVEALD